MNNNLILSANKKSWQVSSLHGTLQDPNQKSAKIYEKIMQRDKNTCFYCSFQSNKFQEVHHLNDDHDDLSLDNLVTVCPLCHQVHHLNLANNTNGGTIIWLPEFTQQELNYILRGLFICMEYKEEEAKNIKFYSMAMSIYQSLESREQIVAQHFYSGAGNDTNEKNTGAFGQMLLNMNEDDYNNRENTLNNFKLLASPGRFSTQIKYWKTNTFQNLPINLWEKLVVNDEAE